MTDPFFRTSVASSTDRVSYDVGLRKHMQRVFNYMAGGLAITGLASYLVGETQLAPLIFGTPLQWVVMFAPLVFLWFGMNFQRITAAAAQTRFWIFCVLMGLSMGWIFLAYTEASIARTFFITAATFAAMSLWGYTTKRDLTGIGAFLMMGVFGILIASVINIFLASAMLDWVVSIIGVGVFTGLTAYDVQRIKQTYAEGWGMEANNKMAVLGALGLYMNFINAFMFLLRLMGDRR